MKKRSFMEKSIIFTFPYQTNGNQATELLEVGHVISEWHRKSTFDFTENWKQLQVEARSRMSNFEICFLLFSVTIQTILKIFSQHGLRKGW